MFLKLNQWQIFRNNIKWNSIFAVSCKVAKFKNYSLCVLVSLIEKNIPNRNQIIWKPTSSYYFA